MFWKKGLSKLFKTGRNIGSMIQKLLWSHRIGHEYNWSPIHIAADYGGVKLCKHIARITDLVNPVNRHGFTQKDMIRFADKSISCSPDPSDDRGSTEVWWWLRFREAAQMDEQ